VKRSDALAPLSRDHHVGLVVAQRLRRATEASAAEAADGFLSFWRADGRRHFRAEEEVLLPWFARHVEPGQEAVVRVLVEHTEIRRHALELESGEPFPAERSHALGELLAGHIRHEERTLFPLIEATVPEDELAGLAAAVERAELEG
jgi:hemerythrin-like domain-containing protein